jgi:hypothetical protein
MELSPAEIVWMQASYDMLFPRSARKMMRPNVPDALIDLMTPRWTGLHNDPPPIPYGEWPWDAT